MLALFSGTDEDYILLLLIPRENPYATKLEKNHTKFKTIGLNHL
jgi:hypothetical protein